MSRIAHPSARLTAGDVIYTVVKSIDELGRVTLSLKELLGTWEENVSNFKAGQTVGGIVRSIERYGVFIELSPNLAGLAEYSDDVEEGDSASVYIKSINPEKMKIKLSIVDSFPEKGKPTPIKYYSEESHIESWQYSPTVCDKIIESVF